MKRAVVIVVPLYAPIIYILSAEHKPSRQQFREFYQSFLRRNPLPVHDLWPVGLADRPARVNPNHDLAAAACQATPASTAALMTASQTTIFTMMMIISKVIPFSFLLVL
tara:strand:- start:2868 stop:3194 length:327 start_codon:yes stop_codon:yes gene_type:complete